MSLGSYNPNTINGSALFYPLFTLCYYLFTYSSKLNYRCDQESTRTDETSYFRVGVQIFMIFFSGFDFILIFYHRCITLILYYHKIFCFPYYETSIFRDRHIILNRKLDARLHYQNYPRLCLSIFTWKEALGKAANDN